MARLILRPPRLAALIATKFNSWGGFARAEEPGASCCARSEPNSILLALRVRPAGRPDLGEDVARIAERLMHAGHRLDDFADQISVRVLDHLGDEILADRLTVLIQADLTVRRIDGEVRQRVLELRLVVAQVAVDLVERLEQRHRRAVVVGREEPRAGQTLIGWGRLLIELD